MLLKNGGLHTVKSICSLVEEVRSVIRFLLDFFFLFSVVVWSSVRTFIVTLVLLFETSRMLILLLLLLLLLLQLSPSTCPVVSSQEHSARHSLNSSFGVSLSSFLRDIGTNMSHFGCLGGEQQGKYRRRTCFQRPLRVCYLPLNAHRPSLINFPPTRNSFFFE